MTCTVRQWRFYSLLLGRRTSKSKWVEKGVIDSIMDGTGSLSRQSRDDL